MPRHHPRYAPIKQPPRVPVLTVVGLGLAAIVTVGTMIFAYWSTP